MRARQSFTTPAGPATCSYATAVTFEPKSKTLTDQVI